MGEGKHIDITDGMNGCERQVSNSSDISPMQDLSDVSIERTAIDSSVSLGSLGSSGRPRKLRSPEELKSRLDRF
jgi:hypothetical protein